MRLWLAKVSRNGKAGLIPADNPSASLLARLEDGECAQFDMIRPRDPRMFRRWWAICALIGDNQEPRRDKKSVCNELKILAGHYDVLHIADTEYEVRTPKSIAFDKLSPEEWAELYPSLEKAGIEKYGAEYFLQEAAA